MSIYSKSRSTYIDLLKHITLPSVRYMQRLTSQVDRVGDVEFVKQLASDLKEEQKLCFLLADEVFVKPGFQYHGGSVYGLAQNKENEKARTILALMVCCSFGGPKFVYKLHPLAEPGGSVGVR